MATATYKRVLVEVDSVKFYPIEAKYAVSRAANQAGRRIGESMQSRAYIWVDPHDTARLSQSHLVELWKMATETKDPLHKISITYYSEDGEKVLSNVEFMGWIGVFQFTNPVLSGIGGMSGDLGREGAALTSQVGYNNMLYLELVVALDEASVSKHKFTK
jgi:hypothetical protein